MDERLRAIVGPTLGDGELAELAAEAKAAALAEVRELLRSAYVEQILARLANGGREPAHAPAAGDGAPSMPAPAAPGEPPASPGNDLAAELAALRAQLAKNRSWLAGEGEAAHAEGGTQPAEAVAPRQPEAPPAGSPQPPAGSPQPSELLWVYAVRRAGAELGAIPGVAPGEPLRAVPCGDLEALVSAVPADEFGEAPLEARLRDLEWLEPVARAHQDALTALLPGGTLVPMRFATLFAGPERVAAMVAGRAGELRKALAYLDGRGEWGVKLFVDEAALAERLADASPAVRELRESIAASPVGAAYMLQKRLERLADEEARRVGDACAEATHARLAAASVAAERSPVREAPGATMLLNGAYLVADEDHPAFTAALADLRAEYAPLGFRLEPTGPWPPYTFAAPRPSAAEEQVGASA